MELVRLGSGEWEVLAIRSGDGDELLPVLEDRENENSGSSARLLRMLVEFIPAHGRPSNPQKFRRIEGGSGHIHEAKERGGLRAFCFQDERRWIVSHAVKKPAERRVPVEESRAARFREEYLSAKETGRLVINDFGG